MEWGGGCGSKYGKNIWYSSGNGCGKWERLRERLQNNLLKKGFSPLFPRPTFALQTAPVGPGRKAASYAVSLCNSMHKPTFSISQMSKAKLV